VGGDKVARREVEEGGVRSEAVEKEERRGPARRGQRWPRADGGSDAPLGRVPAWTGEGKG
jgi:hypothetical protein